jgi:predicted transcriptional regulator
MIRMMISSTLKKEREKRGMTVTELARAANIPNTSLRDAESGKFATRFSTVAKIVNALQDARN